MTSKDAAHFTLANLPLGVATCGAHLISEQATVPGIVTRLSDHVYFLSALGKSGLFIGPNQLSLPVEDAVFRQQNLNALAGLGRSAHREVRNALHAILSNADPKVAEQLATCRVPLSDATMHLPVSIGDFSDYSCSLDHGLNASEAVTGTRSTPPGFLHFPIGYGGRASSIVVSGGPVTRPWGHFKQTGTSDVVFEPSRAVDFELEVACVVGKASEPGSSVTASEAGEHIFGFVLLNDWSARDIQTLEMPPLGPFLGKSLGTTISPWVVLADALEPFLKPVPERQKAVSKHLTQTGDLAHYAVTLTVDISAAASDKYNSAAGAEMMRACTSQLESLYWTIPDMIAHQTSNGCPIRSGDLLATGTVSGKEKGEHGCLLEITRGGKEAFVLEDGAERKYLEDGDTVLFSGWAGEIGSEACVGFGECRGTLGPAKTR